MMILQLMKTGTLITELKLLPSVNKYYLARPQVKHHYWALKQNASFA